MEGGQVGHSWRMCVVGYGYGGLGGDMDRGGGWYACVTKPREWLHAGTLLECEVIH